MLMRGQEEGTARILLDDRVIEPPDYVKTVQDLIVWVNADVLPANRVLTDIVLDGKYLTIEEERESHKYQLADYALIELRSAKTLEIASRALADAREMLPNLHRELVDAYRALLNGSIREGLELFLGAMNSIEWYLNVISAIDGTILVERPWLRLKGEEASQTDAQAQSYVTFESLEDLRSKLARLERAHDNQDFSTLTTLIKDELIPLAEAWKEELPEIIGKLALERHEA